MGKSTEQRPLIYVILLCAISVLIILSFLLVGANIEQFVLSNLEKQDTAIGVAILVILLLTADILVPVPSSSLAIAAGAVLGAPLGGAAIWLGMTCGSLVGYLIGQFGASRFSKLLARSEERFGEHRLTQHFGLLSIAICRPIPVLAEASAIMAGVVRMPIHGYLIVSIFSNLAIAIFYALIGASAIASGSVMWVVLASIAAPVAPWIVYLVTKRSDEKLRRGRYDD